MDREQQLKKELQEIEEHKKAAKIQEQLDRMTNVGKCFATHLLNRYFTKKPSYQFRVIKITGKEYKESDYHPYRYTGEVIGVFKDGDTIRVEKGKYIGSDNDLFKYEITLKEYETVSNDFIPGIEAHINNLRNRFVATDYCSQGDYGDEQTAAKWLDAQGFEHIEFAHETYKLKGSNLTLLEILRWKKHPYLYNTRLYKCQGWLEITERICEEMLESATAWGYSIMDRDYPRIQMLRNFIIEQKALNESKTNH